MDEWTCQRDKEVMKRNCTEQNDGDGGEEEEDEDVAGDGAVGGHVATASDSLQVTSLLPNRHYSPLCSRDGLMVDLVSVPPYLQPLPARHNC